MSLAYESQIEWTHERAQSKSEQEEAIMIELEEEAFLQLGKLVKFGYRDTFAKILSAAFFADSEDAIQLAKDLHLSAKHFYAIDGDKEGALNEIKTEIYEERAFSYDLSEEVL